MSSIITGPNHERRRDSSSAHEEFSPQPIRQQSGDDVSADELDPLSPNEPHITQPQSAGYTASSVKNLRHAQVQESPSDQEMDNISLQPLHPVSSNALGPENAIVSASTATSQTSPKSKSAWSFCLRFLRYGWTADGLGCAIAALSLIAICIILRVHANKPLPEWPYGITINALIAIFTITLKAGVALPLSETISQSKWQAFQSSPRLLIDMEDFDSASRGPWGSAQFLFKIDKTRSSPSWRQFWKLPLTFFFLKRSNIWYYFAKFSALLTIVAFAVDPFSQQLVQFISCSQPSNSTNTIISRTSTYVRAGGHLGAGLNEIDGPMAVAINKGLNDPPQNASILVEASCSTGNCSFPSYSTIGLCSSIHDISDRVHISEPSSKDSYDRNITLDISTGPSITLGPFNTLNKTVLQTIRSVQSESPFGIFEFSILMDNSDRLTAYPESTGNVSAFSANIYPCVRTYNASMRGFVLSETELSSIPIGINQNITQLPEYSFLLATSRTWVNGTLVECHPSQEESTGTVKIPKDNVDAAPSEQPNDPFTEQQSLWYPKECVWRFGQNSEFAIQGALETSLGDLSAIFTMKTVKGPIAAKLLWRNGTATLTSVSQFVQGLTDTMTATIRTNGVEGESAYAHGEMIVQSTCAHIRWAWLSYHVALVTLTVSSLISLLIYSSGGSPSTVWKSSSLAVLFCSIDESLKGKTRFDMGRDEMFRVAETMNAQLVMDATGRARFV